MRLVSSRIFFNPQVDVKMIRFQYLQFSLCALLLFCCGCPSSNGNIGTVEGVVTLDGEPVGQATVMFFPSSGRASIGTTDDAGRYKLVYTRSEDGAVVGTHKVTISTEIKASDGYGDDEPAVQGKKEIIPAKYLDRRKTELTANVEPGSNSINFDLTSE